MRLEGLTFSEWADALPEEGFGVFHTPEALRVLDEHATGKLQLIGAFKGQQPVGLLPIFIREPPGAQVALSPPPGFGIRRMGPMLMSTSPKSRKQEKLNREFTEKVINVVGADSPLAFVYMSCEQGYSDPRPYHWNGFDVYPSFTYRLDLRSRTADEVLKSFSKSLRREIRKGEDTDISIRTQGTAGAQEVYRATQARFEEQGMSFPLTWEFTRDLLEALGERARVYIAESSDGEFLGGIIVLYSNDTAYFWKGGVKRSYQNISVNSLLHWEIITDIIEDPPRDSIDWYDLYTADNERITLYKSKFGGELTAHYKIESAGLPMTIAKKSYQMATTGKRILSSRIENIQS